MPKKKNNPTQPPQVFEPTPVPKLKGTIPENLFKPDKGIKIENEYVIWPSGLKTHLRFIKEAVMKKRNLPVGFYDEAKRLNLPNLNVLAAKAKSLGLKDDVEK